MLRLVKLCPDDGEKKTSRREILVNKAEQNMRYRTKVRADPEKYKHYKSVQLLGYYRRKALGRD